MDVMVVIACWDEQCEGRAMDVIVEMACWS